MANGPVSFTRPQRSAARVGRGRGYTPRPCPLGSAAPDEGPAHRPFGGPGRASPQAVQDRSEKGRSLASAAQTLVSDRAPSAGAAPSRSLDRVAPAGWSVAEASPSSYGTIGWRRRVRPDGLPRRCPHRLATSAFRQGPSARPSQRSLGVTATSSRLVGLHRVAPRR